MPKTLRPMFLLFQGALLLFLFPALWIGDTPIVTTPTPLPPLTTPAASPTPDRLAAPPTRKHPTQADDGAQLFWLHCQPCHGDQGQGLTAEWRAQYPEEDRNCWKSGCHGPHPYENGFTLPASVPAVIGDTTLMRFHSAADLHKFVQRTMPYQAPASLATDEYWAIIAFLLQGRNINDVVLPLQDETTARSLILNPNAPPVAPLIESGATPRYLSFWPLWIILTAGGAILGIRFKRWIFR